MSRRATRWVLVLTGGMISAAPAPCINSMMRELGGVFGIALVVAVLAATGGYASAQAFTDGFGPAIGVSAGLALAGALAALALPSRRTSSVAGHLLQPQEATR
jgi:hypothetical protein